jgi:DNA-directed RNA polymerase specialized sigma24 family protein
MAHTGKTLVWWDRDVDQAGRPIRPDVRLAGHAIWKQACQRTQALLDDQGLAAELMENTVAQVSRYLDHIGAPESSSKHGLLMVAFCRGLRRYATKLNRLELVGGAGELSIRALDEGWIGQVNARLELAKMVRKLSDRNGTLLMLRAAGYEWKDIAQMFGQSPAAIRNSFWREVERIRWPANAR